MWGRNQKFVKVKDKFLLFFFMIFCLHLQISPNYVSLFLIGKNVFGVLENSHLIVLNCSRLHWHFICPFFFKDSQFIYLQKIFNCDCHWLIVAMQLNFSRQSDKNNWKNSLIGRSHLKIQVCLQCTQQIKKAQ